VNQKINTLIALFNEGRFPEAEQLARDITRLVPDHGFSWKVLAVALGLQGRTAESVEPMIKAAVLMPSDAEVHYNLGVILKELGRSDQAEEILRHALELKPGYAGAHNTLGVVLADLGRHVEAEASFRRALEVKPDYALACDNLGMTLKALGRLGEAEAFFRRALELQPDFASAYNNLADTLLDLGRPGDAEISLRKALELRPDYPQAYNNLGNTLLDLGKTAEAEASLRRALELQPDFLQAHNNLGNTLRASGRLGEAEISFRRALALKPDFFEAHNNLGNTLLDLGRLEEAEASLRRALAIKPDFLPAHDNLLFALSHMPRPALPYRRRLQEALSYGQAVAVGTAARSTAWTCPPRPERLRVGIVSGDLGNHPVGYFLEALLSKIDRGRIELVAYPTVSSGDSLTARIYPFFSAWKPLVGQSDEAAAGTIHGDGIHVLLDLAGHTAKNRLPIFARKPAPVQATWLGYWASTGLAEMDFILADRTGVPTRQRAQFIERVVYLPDTRLCFTPPAEAPIPSPLPALASPEGSVTFGCFQALSKVNMETIALWGRVLASIPGARLRWQCKQFDDQRVLARTSNLLARYGIAPAQSVLTGKVPRREYLACYGKVDAVLDSFPFPGGTTTCEALWMGVPTLTLAGDSLLSRQGASLMTAAGLPRWVADSEEQFVARAVELTGSPEALSRLAGLRAGLRAQVAVSPLFDAERFARHFEAALRQMWDRRPTRQKDD
jgi:protein O-GlcNAc transferase